MQCPKCQHVNRKEAKFCEVCGTKLPSVCPHCGNAVRPQSRFCDVCGTPLVEALTPAQVTAPPSLEDMQHRLYIPEPLRQRMEAAGQETAGENRLVTALFADISGFTTLSQHLPTEAVIEKVNQCFQAVMDAVYRYEGGINRFIGDCVLAFFGAPLAHENDPERAVLAALDMREAVSRFELHISVGINTGMMYFGPIGTQQHLEVSAYGPDINLAKRLQEAARPGQILVGGGTYRLTRKAFDFDRPGTLTLKGMEGPVPVYEALRVAERPEKLRGIEGLRARMIGREREFGDLREAADRWLGGQGQMVSIIGEAGIGKSRLVAELKAYLGQRPHPPPFPKAEGEGRRAETSSLSPFTFRLSPSFATGEGEVLWLEGRCISIGQPISYWPFLDMLRGYFGLSGQDSERDVARKVHEGVLGLFPQGAEEVLPFLGRLLSIRFGSDLDRKLDSLTPEQVRHRTLMRLRDLFEALARKQPLLLILEDLHWADDLSLDLISLLMDALATTPLMLLCVYRPERGHRCGQLSSLAQRKCLDRYTEISLKQLSSREGRQLVETLLTIEDLPEGVKGMILRMSEGNPFFIEEVIRSLIDRDLVYREGERWRAREGVSEVDVPDTIQGVVLARVDRLEAEAKAVLQCASVIGRLFKYRLLEHLTQQERDLDRCLSEFEERDLVYEERTVPEVEYAFKHALTQEATYQGILERRRREFHRQVAQGIEGLYRERLEEYYEELAYHYSRSEDVEKAVAYLLKAGEKASRSSAYEAAIDHLQKGLELLKTLPDSPERIQRELDLQIALWPALAATKGYGAPEVESACTRALELCRQVGETSQVFPRVLFGLGEFYVVRADYQTARRLLEQFLGLARRLQDPALLQLARFEAGLLFYYLGEFVLAREHLEQGIALYDPQQSRSQVLLYISDPGLACWVYVSYTLWHLGYPDQALKRSHEALTLVRDLSHPYILACALAGAAWVHQLRREPQEVQERTEELIALSTEQGFSFLLPWGVVPRGWVLVEQGQVEDGIAQMRQGLVAYRATGAELASTYFLALLAEACGKGGQAEEGLNVVVEALAIAERTGERFYEAELYRLKGELLLMQAAGRGGSRTAPTGISVLSDADAGATGRSPLQDEAEACFHKAIEVARGQQAKSLELRAAVSLCRLWQGQGKREEARQMLQEIYGWFTEGFDTADLKEAGALLDDLLRGD